jgi:flavorubredoxin
MGSRYFYYKCYFMNFQKAVKKWQKVIKKKKIKITVFDQIEFLL